jgi:hypothetical protein
MRACWLATLLCACSSSASPRAVIVRATEALDRHDVPAFLNEHVSSEQWSSFVDCKPRSLPIVPTVHDDELARIRNRAEDFASEPDRHVTLVNFEPAPDKTEWHAYEAGDALAGSAICVARHPFRAEKYRVELEYTAGFHGSRGLSTDVYLWNVDDRYWIRSEML